MCVGWALIVPSSRSFVCVISFWLGQAHGTCKQLRCGAEMGWEEAKGGKKVRYFIYIAYLQNIYVVPG